MNLYQAVHKLRQIYRSIAPRPWLIFWKRTSEIKKNIICNLILFCSINMLKTKSKFLLFKRNHTLAKVFHFSSNSFAMIPPSNIFKCSSFVPARIIMIAELQSRKSLDWICKSFLCKSYYLQGPCNWWHQIKTYLFGHLVWSNQERQEDKQNNRYLNISKTLYNWVPTFL